jgi:hypothetical protein
MKKRKIWNAEIRENVALLNFNSTSLPVLGTAPEIHFERANNSSQIDQICQVSTGRN